MSGPVATEDAEPAGEASDSRGGTIEITDSRRTEVGSFEVRRALPKRGRRTVGPWCFLDQIGPVEASPSRGLSIGPHPHMGLQTVTWLIAGEAIHRDSLESEQVIRPGELNLMTAGYGVSHAEEPNGRSTGRFQGMQLWIAQPSATRNGPPGFEHHDELPKVDLVGSIGTVLVGEFMGVRSPARRDTDHVGIDLEVYDTATVVPLRPECEYAVVVLSGAMQIEGEVVEPGHLAYLGVGRDECLFEAADSTRAFLFGGVPFDEPIVMWWNFVARSNEEVSVAHHDWSTASERFGRVASALPRIEVGPPPWTRQTP